MIGGNLKNEFGKRFAVSINNINTDDSGNIELPEATIDQPGLMSVTDKSKIDDITTISAQNGYITFPDKIVMQWGIYNISSDPETKEITLPISLYVTFGRFVDSDNLSLNLSIAGSSTGKIMVKSTGAASGLVYWLVIGRTK